MSEPLYRGRLAPSPTGYLHLGHARTFWMAQQRSEARGGTLVLRSEDLFLVGRDFGDFVVCRHDQIPSYPLAVVVGDAAMRITEVVRGADLLLSTARQILLYRALGWPRPSFSIARCWPTNVGCASPNVTTRSVCGCCARAEPAQRPCGSRGGREPSATSGEAGSLRERWRLEADPPIGHG